MGPSRISERSGVSAPNLGDSGVQGSGGHGLHITSSTLTNNKHYIKNTFIEVHQLSRSGFDATPSQSSPRTIVVLPPTQNYPGKSQPPTKYYPGKTRLPRTVSRARRAHLYYKNWRDSNRWDGTHKRPWGTGSCVSPHYPKKSLENVKQKGPLVI